MILSVPDGCFRSIHASTVKWLCGGKLRKCRSRSDWTYKQVDLAPHTLQNRSMVTYFRKTVNNDWCWMRQTWHCLMEGK